MMTRHCQKQPDYPTILHALLGPHHDQIALTIPLPTHCHSRTPARSIRQTESDRADFVNGLLWLFERPVMPEVL